MGVVAVGLVGCGPSRADEAAPAPETSAPPAVIDIPIVVTSAFRPSPGTLARPTVAPPTTRAATVAPTAAPPSTTTAVERPDPADAPPVDATPPPRSSNAGDFSSPYGPFGPFEVQPLGTRTADIEGLVDLYVELAILGPLRSGTAADLARLLTPTALDSLTPVERAVLTDEGVATAPDVAVTDRAVRVDGIVAPDGSAVANADVEIGVSGMVDGVVVSTTRTGTLTVVLTAGRWKLDAFDLRVDRNLP